MKTIWKFAMPFDDVATVMIPQGATMLSVGVQDEMPMIWAVVDSEAPLTARRFRVAGTGHRLDLESTVQFIGTIQLENGRFIFHIFEMLTNEP